MASAPTSPALRRRFDRRRRAIVVRAARAFAVRGYDQTSMHQLAADLGVAAGGLYHYFPGKEDLLIAICDQLMHPLLEQAEELVAGGAPPADELRGLVRLWVAHVVEHRDQMLVFQQERHVIDHGEQWRPTRQDRKRFERLLGAVLERVSLAHGGALGDTRLPLAALLGMVNHTAQWYRPRGRLSPELIADGYCDMVLALCGSQRRGRDSNPR